MLQKQLVHWQLECQSNIRRWFKSDHCKLLAQQLQLHYHLHLLHKKAPVR